ncbi:hypothetical protein HOD75_04065 [archaeon]|jgi:hypothetical protein|nr:hypothetical protein [Candidatus Woesearchaeota archaeon]MBT4135682.1 hypothetical protein [archaeon]MBT4242043.1 hypothetical protein [archaeon]MBT4417731.1 hypothetical protein [archaeon]
MQENNPKTNYHKAYIPLADVYSEGGIGVYADLERSGNEEESETEKTRAKNLVILTSQIRNQALHSEESALAKKAFSYLISGGTKLEAGDGMVVYDMGEGLDVAYIDDPDFLTSGLEKRVKERFQINNGLKVITRDVKQHLDFEGDAVKVEKPGFLIATEAPHKGLINGNGELYERLIVQNGPITLEEAEEILGEDLFMNQFLRFEGNNGYEYARIRGDLTRNSKGKIIDVENERVTLLGQHEYSKELRVGDQRFRNGIHGIKPQDMEQYLAMQHILLNPDVEIAFISGSQGSGKTLITYAAIINQIMDYRGEINKRRGVKGNRNSLYDQVSLLKAGGDLIGGSKGNIGFLPGDMWKKIEPNLRSYKRAHKTLDWGKSYPFKSMAIPKNGNDFGKTRQQFPTKNLDFALPSDDEAIDILPIGYFRGESFPNTLLVVDEAQNLELKELKAVIERVGIGSKIVILGDPFNQIDNPKCSVERNGLSSAMKFFLPMPQSAMIYLTGNYRSRTSEDTLHMHV